MKDIGDKMVVIGLVGKNYKSEILASFQRLASKFSDVAFLLIHSDQCVKAKDAFFAPILPAFVYQKDQVELDGYCLCGQAKPRFNYPDDTKEIEEFMLQNDDKLANDIRKYQKMTFKNVRRFAGKDHTQKFKSTLEGIRNKFVVIAFYDTLCYYETSRLICDISNEKKDVEFFLVSTFNFENTNNQYILTPMPSIVLRSSNNDVCDSFNGYERCTKTTIENSININIQT